MDSNTSDKAHREFAADAFNKCWEVMNLPERSQEQAREMIRLAEASYWHWQNYSGRTPQNDAISCWQLARVYALSGDASTAISYAEQGLATVRKHCLSAFYVGYAWESAARAYFLAGLSTKGEEALRKAQTAANRIKDPADKAALELDLVNIHSVYETAKSVG